MSAITVNPPWEVNRHLSLPPGRKKMPDFLIPRKVPPHRPTPIPLADNTETRAAVRHTPPETNNDSVVYTAIHCEQNTHGSKCTSPRRCDSRTRRNQRQPLTQPTWEHHRSNVEVRTLLTCSPSGTAPTVNAKQMAYTVTNPRSENHQRGRKHPHRIPASAPPKESSSSPASQQQQLFPSPTGHP